VRNLAAERIGEQEIADQKIALIRCALGSDFVLWWYAYVPPGMELHIGDYVTFSAGTPDQDPGPLSVIRAVTPAPNRSETFGTHGTNTVRCNR
jgi:hypothetical protein